MSVGKCERCGEMVSPDQDPGCLVEVGNMRRMNWTVIRCEPCRNAIYAEQEAEDDRASAAETAYEASQ